MSESEAATSSVFPRNLSGAQRRALRGLGHHAVAIVQIGQAGITPGLVQQARKAVLQHELIKISIGKDAPLGRQQAAEQLAAEVPAHLIQVLGRTALLYSRSKKKPKLALPGLPAAAAPKGRGKPKG